MTEFDLEELRAESRERFARDSDEELIHALNREVGYPDRVVTSLAAGLSVRARRRHLRLLLTELNNRGFDLSAVELPDVTKETLVFGLGAKQFPGSRRFTLISNKLLFADEVEPDEAKIAVPADVRLDIERLDNDITRLLEESGRVDEEALLALVEDGCETDAQREVLDEVLAEVGLDELLSGSMASRCLLSFNWMSWGAPTSSSDSLWLLTMTEHHFVWLPHDFEDVHPLVILAAVPVSEGPIGISGTVEVCLAGMFNWDLMGGRLPTETTNSAPDLLSEQAVKNAYRSVAQAPAVWSELLEDLADLSSRHPEITSELAGAPSPTTEATVDLDSEVGTRPFETWFRLTYSERADLGYLPPKKSV